MARQAPGNKPDMLLLKGNIELGCAENALKDGAESEGSKYKREGGLKCLVILSSQLRSLLKSNPYLNMHKEAAAHGYVVTGKMH